MERQLEIAVMQDYKYRSLAKAPIPDWGWHLSDFRSYCLRKAAEEFQWNVIRTANFAYLPAWIALECTREQLWFDYATVKCGGTIEPDLVKFASQKISPEASAEFDRLVLEFRKIPKETWRILIDQIGVDWIAQRTSLSEGVSKGLEALFSSVVIDAWTAFETLARDLWIATLDNDNGTITSRVHVNGALQKARKSIKPTFNAKTHTGSFQVETRQVTFQRLEEIKKVYTAAFGKPTASLFDTVEGGYITVLNAFRNVISHKRGKADQKFCDQVKDFHELSSIKSGDEIKLDGEMVAKMRNAGLFLGRKLVETADAELQRQQSKT